MDDGDENLTPYVSENDHNNDSNVKSQVNFIFLNTSNVYFCFFLFKIRPYILHLSLKINIYVYSTKNSSKRSLKLIY